MVHNKIPTTLIFILATLLISCQVDSYSKFNKTNLYPNNTSIILPIYHELAINWDSLLTDLSKCNKPILVLEEQQIKPFNAEKLKRSLQTARNLKFHIAIKIPTRYGTRPMEEIAQQLIRIQDILPEINSIFIDEVHDSPDMFDYYYQLSGIARELGYNFIIMNTSNSLNLEQFLQISDALVIYENMGISEDIIPNKSLRDKSIVIIYTSSWQDLTPFIKYLRKGLIAKWIFITDIYSDSATKVLALPSFWNKLIEQICVKG